MSATLASPDAREITDILLPADGHFLAKGHGDTIYRGPLEPLPLPVLPDAAAAATALHEDGVAVFPGVLAPDEVAQLRAFIDASGGPDKSYDHPKWCFNKQVGANWHRHPELLHLVDRQPVVAAARAVLGDDCQITGGSLWVTGPGRQMGLHLDWQPLRLPADVLADPRVQVPIFIASAHYYLDDVTLDLGPTTVIPGSHRAGRPPDGETTWNGQPPKALLVKAGDCMLFRSDIWHGAALNQGPQRRYLIQVHYANIFLTSNIPPVTQAERWDPRCLELMTPDRRKLFGDLGAARVRGTY